MSNYKCLQKVLKIAKISSNNETLLDTLCKSISTIYSNKTERELAFLVMYYGLKTKACTLETIGLLQDNPLTRERVRQIIDSAVIPLKNMEYKEVENPFEKSYHIFNNILAERNFLRFEELIDNEYFIDFKKNIKGFISFLNDCNIRQIAYRKKYYFYSSDLNRKNIIKEIQQENKGIRRIQTVKKMALKSKTVTYVPNEVREHLLSFSDKNKINLNPLYEKILANFMLNKPYYDESYKFSRTKSWKARKGKAEWQQIGIYINKNIFDKIKTDVDYIRNNLGKNVSLMSFICQAFVWHYQDNNK